MKKMRGSNRRAAALVLLVILIPVALAISSYIINTVYMELARTELQISTDVATRAAGRVYAVTGDEQEAMLAANRLLELNPYANTNLSLADTDITFGASTRFDENQRYDFVPDGKANAVSLRTFGREDVPMIFPTFGVPIEFRSDEAGNLHTGGIGYRHRIGSIGFDGVSE